MKTIVTAFLCVFLCLPAAAIDTDAILSRMEKRVPETVPLFQKGVIGENNKGFLEFLKPDKSKESIINEENTDRLSIYKYIALKQDTSVELVGKRRAEQIAKKASYGEWLQLPDGKWHQKTASQNNKLQPPEMPDSIYIKIKNKCENEWPDDYAMQKFCIKRQTKAWRTLNE